MKLLIITLIVSSFSIADTSASKKENDKKNKIALEKIKALDKKEQDCDEKAKKPIEIKPESISLTGNAGCSLDEAH